MRKKYFIGLCAAVLFFMLMQAVTVTASSFSDGGPDETFAASDNEKTAFADGETSGEEEQLYGNRDIEEYPEDEIINSSDIISENGLQYKMQSDNLLSLVGAEEGIVECVIPYSVHGIRVYRIEEGAFRNCEKLVSVEIPDSVYEIEKNAFYGAAQIRQIVVSPENAYYKAVDNVLFTKSGSRLIVCAPAADRSAYAVPKGVKRIDESAFAGCRNLKEVTVPDSVVKIGKCAFRSCTGLTKITLSQYLEEIPDIAFGFCTQLKEIEIPERVLTIGGEAFAFCTSLEKVTFSKQLTLIKSSAFSQCKNLKEIHFPDLLDKIESGAFLSSGLEKAVFEGMECQLSEENDIFPEKTIYYGYKGSSAQKFADRNGYTFVALGLESLEPVQMSCLELIEPDCIRLGWHYLPGADGYVVLRKEFANGQWKELVRCKSDQRVYTDDSTKIGIRYYYTVRAFVYEDGKIVYGDYDKKGLNIKQRYTPDQVEIVKTKQNADSSLGIMWIDREKIDGYQIFRKGEKGSWKCIKTLGKTNSFCDRTCKPATRYYYKVRGFTRTNDNIFYTYVKNQNISMISKIRLPKIKASAEGNGKVKIQWSMQEGITGYNVCRRKEGSTTWKKIKGVNANVSSYTDSTAQKGKTYYYMVRAYKKADPSAGIPKNLYGPYSKYGMKVKIK